MDKSSEPRIKTEEKEKTPTRNPELSHQGKMKRATHFIS